MLQTSVGEGVGRAEAGPRAKLEKDSERSEVGRRWAGDATELERCSGLGVGRR